ncbi:RnfABCDGE type electron transport complex subunit D [candidate division NPL-UPA2 bacterium Unc8]|uniref:Ion-translocating oxidoreductase complex subunit D n=1 Tax=candidate division NPL-UPA2 bacterium Unc8 TaxID=1980939 RepID=A0A399FWJ4_UNCN2|nr:Electron transport complex subunit RsxD [Bacillota bacterium]MBT9138288.1 Electron transport complex subunit RsxD [Bacillota bacterium]MBT9146452.1 Electron transport complex subunit RsxD [Bacillota bacterium]RII00541.1 MAG: RnfABCDGE type electron transport complex subunit D [candidate division NPL-UPA2 bacterium Unc8]
MQRVKEAKNSSKNLVVSVSPHLRGKMTTMRIMWETILSLSPAVIVGIYIFGVAALSVILTVTISAILTEALIQKSCRKKVTINDGSAALTGILLSLTLPPGVPLWLAGVGGVIAISLGKQVFGGLGKNPFNPALVGRAVLLISFPEQMTTWRKPAPGIFNIDAVSTATPLGILKEEGASIAEVEVSLLDAFLGNISGSIGEVSAIALIAGATFLLIRGHISAEIPISFVATVMLFTIPFWLHNPENYASPVFHLLTGGLLLGAFFMATDMVTTPLLRKGKLIFGIGCGLLTALIRLFGGIPEGVLFSILIMNGTTPLIDRYTRPRYGRKK